MAALYIIIIISNFRETFAKKKKGYFRELKKKTFARVSNITRTAFAIKLLTRTFRSITIKIYIYMYIYIYLFNLFIYIYVYIHRDVGLCMYGSSMANDHKTGPNLGKT